MVFEKFARSGGYIAPGVLARTRGGNPPRKGTYPHRHQIVHPDNMVCFLHIQLNSDQNMQAFIEGTLVLVQKPKPFTDNKTGEQVTYYINTIQTEDQSETLTMNSKTDFTSYKDEPSVLTIQIRTDKINPKLCKITLQDVKSQK